jgi:hypothetical protein
MAMPIPFSCECGKKLQAKDEFAGKRLKCPGCGKILTIPTPAVEEPELEEEPAPPVTQRIATPPEEVEDEPELPLAPPPPAPAVVHFVCNCGRRLKALQADAGEPIDCPECARTLTIPAEDSDEPPPVPVPKARPVSDGLFAQTITPWRDEATRRRGADGKEPRDEKVGSWAGTFLVVLLLVGGGAALWYFSPDLAARAREAEPKGPPASVKPVTFDELDRIPADAVAFLTVRPDAAGVPVLGLNVALGERFPARMVHQLLSQLGPIQRLTVVSFAPDPFHGGNYEPPFNKKEAWLIVRTRSPYDRKVVLDTFNRQVARVVPKSYAGKHYLIGAVPPKAKAKGIVPPMAKPPERGAPPPEPVQGTRSPALYFAAPDVLVLGDIVSMRRFLASRLRHERPGTLAQAVTLARDGKPLVIGLNQTAHVLMPSRPVPTPPELPPLLPVASGYSSASVAVSAAGDLRERIQFDFDTPRAAWNAARALEIWKAAQEQRRLAARFEIAQRRSAGIMQSAARAVALAAPGQMSPVGPLHFASDFSGLIPTPQEWTTLERLKAEEVFQNNLGTFEPKRTQLTLRVHLRSTDPVQARALAYRLVAAFAALALHSTPVARLNEPPDPLPKGRKGPKGKKGR